MKTCQPGRHRLSPARFTAMLAALVCVWAASGCYAPLRSPGIPARELPEYFRTAIRTAGPPLNYANLTARPPADYPLGPNDVLSITVPSLFEGAEVRPLKVQVMASGEIQLPIVGTVKVGGMNLLQAQQAINEAYADGFLKNPRASVSLLEKRTVSVVVLGEVNKPGVYELPKFQNDVGHALASAGGLGRDADEVIEVHRRIAPKDRMSEEGEEILEDRLKLEVYEDNPQDPKKILRIPLRGLPFGAITEEDMILHPGDVIVVPSRKHEVFFVVGLLNQTNLVRFSLGDRERELGTGLILPREREIDVVKAVAMAGYIDPITSPTKCTVHRVLPDGEPLLIKVDLIAARFDARETIYIQGGDIIYLDPDPGWYFRKTLDRIVPELLLIPYAKGIGRAN